MKDIKGMSNDEVFNSRDPRVMCAYCGKDFLSLNFAKQHSIKTGHNIHG